MKTILVAHSDVAFAAQLESQLHNADLIVMSSAARTGVARAFLGSVADAVGDQPDRLVGQ